MLIGLSAAVMLLGAGRIAEVGGMAGRTLNFSRSSTPWPMAAMFVGGIALGGLFWLSLVRQVEAHFLPSLIQILGRPRGRRGNVAGQWLLERPRRVRAIALFRPVDRSCPASAPMRQIEGIR